jgi:hypothetical protein
MLRSSIAVLAALLVAGAASAAGTGDGVWVNGVRHPLVTGPPSGSTTHPVPLYVVAPVDPAAPLHPLADARTHGFGAHDHVIAPGSGARTCDLQLVVPGPKARVGRTVWVRSTLTPAGVKPLAYAVRIGAAVEPLTWVSRVRHAVGLGLARTIDTGVVLGCTVS